MIDGISETFQWDTQRGTTARLALSPVLDMFHESNLNDWDNISLLIHIVTKCTVDGQLKGLFSMEEEDHDSGGKPGDRPSTNIISTTIHVHTKL